MVDIITLVAQVVLFMMKVGEKDDDKGVSDTVKIVFIVLGGITALPVIGFLFFVLGLGIFHLFLKCQGKTTREYLKKKEHVVGENIGNDWFKNTPPFLDYQYQLDSSEMKALETWNWKKDSQTVTVKNNEAPLKNPNESLENNLKMQTDELIENSQKPLIDHNNLRNDFNEVIPQQIL